MTTFSADGTPEAAPASEQLAPPPDLSDHAELSETEKLADYNAAQSRVDAGLPAQDGDEEKIAAFVADASTDDDVPDPRVVEPAPEDGPGTTIALAPSVDVSKLGEDWPYDWLEFKGDKLGIRLPTRQALAAFSLASSKYVSLGVKNDLTGLFIARHLSPESYGRVFSRLMDPDESDYDVDTVGELFNAIVMAAVNADKPDAAK
ncbi:tail assembly chaperone [Mycobacterium phage PenguinLover67]|nr:tail assembly chaperone [Mycobacterium phage PenguinLover67]